MVASGPVQPPTVNMEDTGGVSSRRSGGVLDDLLVARELSLVHALGVGALAAVAARDRCRDLRLPLGLDERCSLGASLYSPRSGRSRWSGRAVCTDRRSVDARRCSFWRSARCITSPQRPARSLVAGDAGSGTGASVRLALARCRAGRAAPAPARCLPLVPALVGRLYTAAAVGWSVPTLVGVGPRGRSALGGDQRSDPASDRAATGSLADEPRSAGGPGRRTGPPDSANRGCKRRSGHWHRVRPREVRRCRAGAACAASLYEGSRRAAGSGHAVRGCAYARYSG